MGRNNSDNFIINLPNIGNNLESIEIRTFQTPIDISNFSIFSWLSFFAIIIIAVLVVYWIYLFVRLGIEAIQSEGDKDKLTEVSKKARSILISVVIFFLFPLVLSFIGTVLGVGNIFQWPKMFSVCEETTDGPIFYYQVFLGEGESNFERADSLCKLKGN
ncbi:MAG: hypothetical protein ABIK31_04970 [candidate division WOR-3 bacterium]